MSINKLISIKNPIINALTIVGADRAKDMPVYVNWAMEAEKEIGSFYGFVKKKVVLDITGCKAEIPCDAVYIQMAVMGAQDCNCNDLTDLCDLNGIQVNGPLAPISPPEALDQSGFLIVDFGSTRGLRTVDFQIQNNKIVFSSNQTSQHVTVQYLGVELDCDGLPMIGENHVRAIEHYILYRYAIRSKFSSNPININDTMLFKGEWDRLCKHARADDAELSPTERRDIVAQIHNPFAGHSLSQGMHYVFGIY